MSDLIETAWALPSDSEIKEMLVQRIDRERGGVGIVVGVIDAAGRRVVAHGRYSRRSRRNVDGDTLFEIGSISKVFTSLLLSDMALRGDVALDDPVAKHLPDGVAIPERGGRQITLKDLATHTSGLPRMPNNFAPQDVDNPYADYTVDQLYAFLAGHTLARDIGAEFEYSNLAVGLLGHALGRRRGTDYERLVAERIAGPLGLADTVISLSPGHRRRLADGHDADRRRVHGWDLPDAFAGAGALRSTANDMLSFLAVVLGYRGDPLKRPIDAQLAFPTRPTPIPNNSVGLAWVVREDARGRVAWHNGGTGGFRTFMGVNQARGWGAVVLTNTATPAGGDDIGMHILTGAPLAPPPKRRRSIRLAPAILDSYVGRYRYAFDVTIDIKRQGDGLAADVSGRGEAMIFAASRKHFFWRAVDAELWFETDAEGRPVALTTRNPEGVRNRAVRL